MFHRKKINLIVFIIISITSLFYFSCSEEEEDYNTINLDNRIQTPYLISAYINSTFCKFDFCSSLPDTITSVYNTFGRDLIIMRYASNSGNANNDSTFQIFTNNIDLDQLVYPKTFYPKHDNFINNANDSSGLTASLILSNQKFSRSETDSALFTVTFTNFINDTLFGNFQGTLFSKTHQIDSVRNVTNGEFKILLTRK
jgi:hypothetical protein